MPQDRHLDPMTTREVSRPRQTHTWHFTVFGGGRDWRNFTRFSRHKSLSARSVSFGEDISPHWTSSQELSLSMTSHWWSILNSASQFTQLSFSGARGTGDGISFKQGEKWAGEFSGIGWLLRISFSGDSTSLSPIWMSFLILCDKEGWFEGEGLGESGKGRLLPLGVLTDKAETACRRWTQACAARRREPFSGGGRVGAAKAALCSTERR